MIKNLQKEIRELANPKRAESSMWFFKTKKGEYGAHDQFLGLTVPMQRKLSVKYGLLPLTDCEKLLHSKYHEDRLIALFIMVLQFQKGDDLMRSRIYELYLKNTKHINNWDLVDASADKIVGNYLLGSQEAINTLETLAQSKDLWEKRIAMISTFAFIKKGSEKEAFMVADLLLHDTHDLIHKAVGWMLREVGKRVSVPILEEFLKPRYKNMPRTSLRYAIEKFPEDTRRAYLLGSI